jgi:hypothetical protein
MKPKIAIKGAHRVVESNPPKNDKTSAENEATATTTISADKALPQANQGANCRYHKKRDGYDVVTLLIAFFGLIRTLVLCSLGQCSSNRHYHRG